MPSEPKYDRIILKLTGESLAAPGEGGVDTAALEAVAAEIRPVLEMGTQVGVVIGGGNFHRGRDLAGNPHVQRATADCMGMLATVMNALALRDALDSLGMPARLYGAFEVMGICERFYRTEAIEAMETGHVVVLAGGTGSPFVSTDTCAALRANELNANAVLKATKVDGVFDKDPLTNPDAKRYTRLTYGQVLHEQLGVMDLTAVTMCMEGGIPIVVFKMAEPGNLARVVAGEDVGTVISG